MSRISPKELNNCVFKPDDAVNKKPYIPSVTKCYKNHPNPSSLQDLETDRNNALAIAKVDDYGTSYYIKTGPSGFFNPNSMYPERTISGVDTFRFEQVGQKAFDLYIQFLLTNANTFLELAGRERG